MKKVDLEFVKTCHEQLIASKFTVNKFNTKKSRKINFLNHENFLNICWTFVETRGKLKLSAYLWENVQENKEGGTGYGLIWWLTVCSDHCASYSCTRTNCCKNTFFLFLQSFYLPPNFTFGIQQYYQSPISDFSDALWAGPLIF